MLVQQEIHATSAQEDAAVRMLNEAFGPLLAVAAPGAGAQAIAFWGPRIAQAVVEAKP